MESHWEVLVRIRCLGHLLRARALRKAIIIRLCMYSILPLEKYLEAEGSFQSCVFCLDCNFRNYLDYWNLCKKKVLILDWCYTCNSNGQSVDHLLLHCPIVYELWSMVFTLFGIHWAMPKTVVEILACWQRNFGHHRICYLDGCHSFFDVVHLTGEKQPVFWRF